MWPSWFQSAFLVICLDVSVAIEGLYVIQRDKHNRFVVLALCPALGHLVAEMDGALAAITLQDEDVIADAFLSVYSHCSRFSTRSHRPTMTMFMPVSVVRS
jgi:hypothetical protein